ncbi:LytTR family DNA-binding domain-containing protein [Qipengyuania atrilutea]|uniref:LytTR family transcriptional regulator n=1 Tax=Qipengyuania atrilutea TaxID=2744473 RepID=A0A850H0B0_9SPHN|nr:LytTR family DNA-binding domain-containing protein [Actirhodobacter atriluteus]NVD45321.1 LytTR family transcriptional regulator [Actirhodobacter atriluteus]
MNLSHDANMFRSRHEVSLFRRVNVKAMILFWIVAFVINSIRAYAMDELPFHLAGGHRIAAFSFAGLMSFLLAEILARASDSRTRIIYALLALAIMPFAHSFFLKLSCSLAPIEGVAPMSWSECVVQALIMTGYFAAWIAAHFALANHKELSDVRLAMRQSDFHARTLDTGETCKFEAEEDRERHIFWAANGTKHVKIEASDIQWVQANGDYVVLHTDDIGGMMRSTLAKLEGDLGSAFLRVHRSALVRREAIASVVRRPSGTITLTLKNGSDVPVGRSYSRGLRELRERL